MRSALSGPAASRLSGALHALRVIEDYTSLRTAPAGVAAGPGGPVRLVGRPEPRAPGAMYLFFSPPDSAERATPPPALSGPLVEKVFQAESAGGASAPNDDGSQVVVAQISSIVPLGPEAMATNSAGIDRVLADSLRQDMAEYFARAVEARHGAVVEPGVIDEVFTRLGAVSYPTQ